MRPLSHCRRQSSALTSARERHAGSDPPPSWSLYAQSSSGEMGSQHVYRRVYPPVRSRSSALPVALVPGTSAAPGPLRPCKRCHLGGGSLQALPRAKLDQWVRSPASSLFLLAARPSDIFSTWASMQTAVIQPRDVVRLTQRDYPRANLSWLSDSNVLFVTDIHASALVRVRDICSTRPAAFQNW